MTEKRYSRRNDVLHLAAVVLAALLLFSGCGAAKDKAADEPVSDLMETDSGNPGLITVGFSQLGAESDYRSASTESMRKTFTTENGYELLFEDGQQKQANQIKAIRIFIQREVDYIVLAPVTETGWDTVLMEAKNAGIPVILMDRMVDVEDDSLFTCWVGSDFELEGRKAAAWLKAFAAESGIKPSDLHIVNIQGTIGASAQIGRTKGLSDAAAAEGWDLLDEVTGDFTQARGREVMADLLKKYDNINVVYCENDNEALGAIEAIEEAGKKTGSDILSGEILVISFDGVKREAMEYVLSDRISCIAQCNPLQGPMIEDVIRRMENGETPEKFSYVEEGIYSAIESVPALELDGTTYPVTILTEQILEDRAY